MTKKIYKVVQIWPGLIVRKQVTVCAGHIWTTLYFKIGIRGAVYMDRSWMELGRYRLHWWAFVLAMLHLNLLLGTVISWLIYCQFNPGHYIGPAT
jgi:hypothetical protein